jgi:hypothetical protein
MNNLQSWEVDLSVSGPISLSRKLSLDVEKGYEHPFTTNVRLRKTSYGVSVTLIARASSQSQTNSAAIFFVGQMLDLLAHWIDLPLYLGITGTETRIPTSNTRRIVHETEWRNAFERSRMYGQIYPSYSRSLSWYRKGLISEDPIDKYLAFWSALESVGSKHARDNERTRRGSVNQICDCFDQLWESVETWKVIQNNADWVNRFHETRNGISHGYIQVEVETIRQIAEQLPTLKSLVHSFLEDWENYLPEER